MISRRALIALALAAGALSGIAFLTATRRVPVLVAARDLDATSPLVAADLAIREFPVDAVPEGALDDPGRAVGRTPRAPLARGQLVLAGSLADRITSFSSGLVPPRGTRAIALAANPSQAIGGALVPGARVDVFAVPQQGRAPAGRPTELLASNVLVLDVRTESGGPVTKTSSRPSNERLGSVVIAIPVQDELRVADRVASSTFVFVLAGERS